MKINLATRLAIAAAAVACFAHASFAQTWQTVDDFQYVAGQPAANWGLAVAPGGTLFAAGFGSDSSVDHGLDMASADGGSTWSGALDDFVYGPGYSTRYDGGITADAAGNIYVSGRAYAVGVPTHLIVRRCTDGGLTWSTVDDFVPGGTSTFFSRGITADAAGSVYLTANNAENNWTIRKGVGGTSFSTVDSFGPGSRALAVFAHPPAGIFAAGYGTITIKKSSSQALLVRRSLDGGATWSTVDTFQLTIGQESLALGLGADVLGNVYVVGRANATYRGSSYKHWMVRKSSNGGGSWSTVDDYLATTGSSEARQFAADSHGNLFVIGEDSTAPGNYSKWIVRENPGGTGGWQTVDSLQYVAGYESDVRAIAADAYGHVYVGGRGMDASSFHWVVRKH